MRIYTKTGDKGDTGLVGGKRVSKASSRIWAIGEVDELNSCIGLCIAAVQDPQLNQLLIAIQNWLFDLGAELAGKEPTEPTNANQRLEASIDEQTAALAPLRNFILPGGSEAAARLHHARCVCRRAERVVLELQQTEPVHPDVIIFLNRLSDWLFTAARTANRLLGVEDIEWKRTEA